MKRKLFAIICCISLIVTTVTPAFAGTTQYAHRGDQLLAVSVTDRYLETLEEAAASLRQSMTERDVAPVIKYHVASKSLPDVNLIMEEIFDKACEHTGKSNEGDALKWDWKTWDCNVSYKSIGNDYYFDMHFVIDYYSNAEQERAVKQAISELKKELNIDGKSDVEKIDAIYHYILSNVSYDYTNLHNPSYDLKYTAYAALVNKTSVCQGYATLFYRLALEYGIDARVIAGSSFGQAHGWNIVKLGTKYYYVDATWDSQRSEREYYLKGIGFLKEDHSCSEEYITPAFLAAYPIADSDFTGFDSNPVPTPDPSPLPTPDQPAVPAPEPDPAPVPNPEAVAPVGKVKLSTYKYVYNQKVKSPKIIVQDVNGNVLKKNVDYKVTVPKGRKNVGKYTYTIQFTGRYDGLKRKKLTLIIKPSKPAITAPKSGKKALVAKWKQVKKQTDGYQIMVSTDKSFHKNVKRAFVKKNKTTSKKIVKLKAKKMYYVKVRSYKIVKGSKIYSDWSKVRSVKVK